jgi:hypothetical protein
MTMDHEEMMAEVGRRVSTIPCVRTYRYLTEQMRRDIMLLERDAEVQSLETGIMPFINRGVWAALDREVQLVIVMEPACEILPKSNSLVHIEDAEGNVIGEWLSKERREREKDRKDMRMIGEDFALYSELEITGKPYFVLPEVDFAYLDGVEGVKNVTSGSLSPPADLYLHKVMVLDDPALATHIVGFDIE